MARFTEGQQVRSRASAQRLMQGAVYTVAVVLVDYLPFGEFVTYILKDASGESYPVGNGHLLLEEVC